MLPIASPIYFFLSFALLLITVVPLLVRVTPQSWFESKNRNHNLEGLRGLLAPSVFFHHVVITYYSYVKNGVWELPPSDFYGKMGPGPVLIFFFLTGYLFWSQNLDARRAWSARDFFVKRARRLMPAFYAMTFMVAASSWLLHEDSAGSTGAVVGEFWSWFVFGLPYGLIQNFFGFALSGRVVAYVYWTIRYEWWFYLVFPVLRRARSLWALLVFLVLCLFGTRILGMAAVTDWVHEHDFFTRGYEVLHDLAHWLALGFGPGMLVSYARNQEKLLSWASTRTAQVLAILAVVIFFVGGQSPLSSSFYLGFMFAVVALDRKQWKFLHRRSFQLLGQTSYGIYLYHGVTLFWAFRWINAYTPVSDLHPLIFWSVATLCGAITFCLSYASYRWLEKPTMEGRLLRRL